jgi:hypothetical protein
MILTPIDNGSLPDALARLAASLRSPTARRVLRRIAAAGGGSAERASGRTARRHLHDALHVVRSFGMEVHLGAPNRGVTWDGRRLRVATEAYILLHEVAHYQVAAPRRRRAVDFGLGTGTETGRRAVADRAALLHGIRREREEALASLLGILWEASLGHPALASFLDQNWLEGAGRPGTAAHFETTLRRLRAEGLVDPDGTPTRLLRRRADGHSTVVG